MHLASVLLLAWWPQVAAPGFEVASIKPSAISRTGGEGSRRERVTVSPSGVTFVNASLSFCVQWAYDVRFYQVAGPEWTREERFDVIAKSESPVSAEGLRRRMQGLLAERFRLQLRREVRSEPVYELEIRGKGRLRKAAGEGPARMGVSDGGFVFEHVTMAEFAAKLSDLAAIDRPVVDRTGVEGVYDVTLPGAAREMLANPGSIFTAIEDAGFKLAARKGPVEMLVIEGASRPSGN